MVQTQSDEMINSRKMEKHIYNTKFAYQKSFSYFLVTYWIVLSTLAYKIYSNNHLRREKFLSSHKSYINFDEGSQVILRIISNNGWEPLL